MMQLVRSPPANAGDERETGFLPGSERAHGIGNGNPPVFITWKIPRTEKHGGLQFTGSQSPMIERLSMHTLLTGVR